MDLSNYAMKADPKGEVKIDWNSLKAQVDKINVIKMRTVPADLSKPSTVVDTDVVQQTVNDKLVTIVLRYWALGD